MLEEEIKEYYDSITPSDETRTALLAKIKLLRKRRATYKLLLECFVSAAACFPLAVIINCTKVFDAATTPDKWIGTVLSEPNGYVITGMLFIILIIAFVILYKKNINGNNAKKHKDIHE